MLQYTASAGAVDIRDNSGKIGATMFYAAYFLGSGSAVQRPVTFFFNGGPGSSSIWLHLGSFGPRRIQTQAPFAALNPPYDLGDNNDSLLDRSDLVFLDQVGTGFSRPQGGADLKSFWGTDPDIDAFGRGIERFLTVYGRWNSPKILFGESYGTARAAGLALRLQRDGVQLNGVILLSSFLNYGRRDTGFDREMVNFIPTFAAVSAYHNRLKTPPSDLLAFLQEVRDWAQGPYSAALAIGQYLPQEKRQQIAEQMAAYTGLPVQFILNCKLRVDPFRYRKELLREQRRSLGRYDARFTGDDEDAQGEEPDGDVSSTGIRGPFTAALHPYLVEELGYRTSLDYRATFYSAMNGGLQWNYDHRGPAGRGAEKTHDNPDPHVPIWSMTSQWRFERTPTSLFIRLTVCTIYRPHFSGPNMTSPTCT